AIFRMRLGLPASPIGSRAPGGSDGDAEGGHEATPALTGPDEDAESDGPCAPGPAAARASAEQSEVELPLRSNDDGVDQAGGIPPSARMTVRPSTVDVPDSTGPAARMLHGSQPPGLPVSS